MNMYAYTHDDPINGTDPFGLDDCDGGSVSCVVVTAARNIDQGLNLSRGIGGLVNNLNNALNNTATALSAIQVNGQRKKDSCQAPAPVTPEEMGFANAGNRSAFWKSRNLRGDPIAGTALDIVNNSGFDGAMGNGRLFAALSERPGNDQGMSQIRGEMQTIGVQLMQAHIAAIRQNPGGLTPGIVAAYHHAVFAQHGLSPDTL